jgi:hypothetical protein
MTEAQLRVAAIAEELDEVEEGIPELTGIWNHLLREHVGLATAAYPYLKEKLDLLRLERKMAPEPPPAPRVDVTAAVAQLQELTKLLAQLQGSKPPVQPGQGVQTEAVQAATGQLDGKHQAIKQDRRYRLVSTDVDRWTTKPQVLAIMEVLKAHFQEGDVFTNSQAVEAVRANRQLLGTRQDPADVWDYYKGRSADGLLQHGNIELA